MKFKDDEQFIEFWDGWPGKSDAATIIFRQPCGTYTGRIRFDGEMRNVWINLPALYLPEDWCFFHGLENARVARFNRDNRTISNKLHQHFDNKKLLVAYLRKIHVDDEEIRRLNKMKGEHFFSVADETDVDCVNGQETRTKTSDTSTVLGLRGPESFEALQVVAVRNGSLIEYNLIVDWGTRYSDRVLDFERALKDTGIVLYDGEYDD